MLGSLDNVIGHDSRLAAHHQFVKWEINEYLGWVVEFCFIFVRVAFPINWVLHCIKLGCFGCCSGWLMKCPANILDVSLKLSLAFSLPLNELEGALKCVHGGWTLKYMFQEPLSFFLERKMISTKQEIKTYQNFLTLLAEVPKGYWI